MNDSHTNKKLLSTVELSKFLGISQTTIYRLIEKREIPFYKIKGSIRFDEGDVMAYLEENRVESIK